MSNDKTNLEIKAKEYPLKDVFGTEFKYEIPKYQRPYSWREEHAEELFYDLYGSEDYPNDWENHYFLGSIVLVGEPGARYQVVDGQQRLTTLSILLVVLYHLTEKETLRNYIYEKGDSLEGKEAGPRLKIRDKDQDFFEEYIQNCDKSKFESLLGENFDPYTEPQRLIQKNAKLFNEKCKKEPKENLYKFLQFLVNKCTMVIIESRNRASAFRIFSVLNTRGLDLLSTDILKSEIIGDVEDKYTAKWENCEALVGRSDFERFFEYIRMIFYKKRRRKKLEDEILESEEVRNDSKKFIDEILEPYTDSYKEIRENTNAISSLIYLKRIGHSEWMPCLLLFRRLIKHEESYYEQFCDKLERLAAYLHLSHRKTINDRVKRYAEILNELDSKKENHGPKNPIESVELTQEEKSEMKEIVERDVYYLPSGKVKYLLLRLSSFLAEGGQEHSGGLTVEHVLPQNPSDGWSEDWTEELRNKWTHKIANLVLLNRRKNSASSNLPFKQKKNEYFSATKGGVTIYALTIQVLHTENWTPDVVENRQKRLVDTLIKGWKLNVAQ